MSKTYEKLIDEFLDELANRIYWDFEHTEDIKLKAQKLIKLKPVKRETRSC